MAVVRVLAVGVLLVTALLLELTVLPLLHLPGATPDLLLVTVLALGLRGGPARGAWTGFVAGIMLDVVPPATGVLGISALVMTLAGYLAGVLGAREDRPALLTLGWLGLIAGGTVIAQAVVGGVVSDDHVSWQRVPGLALSQALYAAVLAAFVVPAVAALMRRLDPPAPRYDVGRLDR